MTQRSCQYARHGSMSIENQQPFMTASDYFHLLVSQCTAGG
jgi:hypothetical protein